MKLALARAMLMNADIMLLDEPTNHLDVTNVQWLINYLVGLKGVTSVVVSHDSGFLDAVCSSIIHYEDNFKLKKYLGNLSKFVQQRPEAAAYYSLADASTKWSLPEPGFLEVGFGAGGWPWLAGLPAVVNAPPPAAASPPPAHRASAFLPRRAPPPSASTPPAAPRAGRDLQGPRHPQDARRQLQVPHRRVPHPQRRQPAGLPELPRRRAGPQRSGQVYPHPPAHRELRTPPRSCCQQHRMAALGDGLAGGAFSRKAALLARALCLPRSLLIPLPPCPAVS